MPTLCNVAFLFSYASSFTVPEIGPVIAAGFQLFGALFGSDDSGPSLSDVLTDLFKQVTEAFKDIIQQETAHKWSEMLQVCVYVWY
jgi:uncharacterized BrkB/YihY/UPF0761 family membrane protein